MAVKFANLNRVMINDLSIRRNTLDPNNKGILELQSVATGTENDPFDYGKTGIVPYLQNISKNDPSKKVLSGKFMRSRIGHMMVKSYSFTIRWVHKVVNGCIELI